MVFVPCRQYNLFRASLIRDGFEVVPTFPEWVQVVVDGYTWRLEKGNAQKLHDLSIPPTFIARSYKSLAAYDNHFRPTSWPNTNTMVIYNLGVMDC
jgi:hypothetical protein